MIKQYIMGCTLDGYISKDDHVCLKTDKSLNFIKQLQVICTSIGIPTYINEKWNKEYEKYYYNLFVEEDGIKILKNMNFIFPEKHKQNRFNKIRKKHINRKAFMMKKSYFYIEDDIIDLVKNIKKECYELKSNKFFNRFHHIYNTLIINKRITLDSLFDVFIFKYKKIPQFLDNNYLFSEVIENENIEIETADIEVENEHNYIANGFISHNTIICPKEFKSEQLNNLLLEYIRDLKGVTLYVDGSRKGQILNSITKKEAKKLITEGKIIENQEERNCSTGLCEI